MRSKIIFFILTLAVLIVISGCGKKDVVINNSVESDKTENIATSSEENIIPGENNDIFKLVGREESGWNIYHSKTYGFEIKIPERWNIDSFNKDSIHFSTRDKEEIYSFTILISEISASNKKILSIDDIVNIECTNIEFYDSCAEKTKNGIIEFKKINDFTVKVRQTVSISLTPTVSYYYYNNKNKFLISFYENNKQLLSEFEEIMKTIEFEK